MFFVSNYGIIDPPEGEELMNSSGRGRESGSRCKIRKVSSQKKNVSPMAMGTDCSFFLYPSFPASLMSMIHNRCLINT